MRIAPVTVTFLACALAAFAPRASAAPDDPPSKEMIRDTADAKPQKFLPPTKQEVDAMMKLARDRGEEVADKMRIKFRTIETTHFIMFTDWDPREESFLRTNVELAYNAVSKQFDIPGKDTIFVGKLPVYMFAQHADFMKFAQQLDNFDVTETIAGYYHGDRAGHGHMAMWKPDIKKAGGDVHLAERNWAYVLTHEFTHAFVNRYHTNAFIPRWLNEGLAEVIASGQFPRDVYHALKTRKNNVNVQELLDQKELLKAPDYPVARTLVETLIIRDRKAFIRFFDDIKEGLTYQEALKREYQLESGAFDFAWRHYVDVAGK